MPALENAITYVAPSTYQNDVEIRFEALKPEDEADYICFLAVGPAYLEIRTRDDVETIYDILGDYLFGAPDDENEEPDE